MTQRLVGWLTSGMMRPIASMRWKWVSSKVSSGYFFSSALASDRISPNASMPANPPPMTTNVRRASRSAPGGRAAALSKLLRMRSRT